jgi:hypothetical protein
VVGNKQYCSWKYTVLWLEIDSTVVGNTQYCVEKYTVL